MLISQHASRSCHHVEDVKWVISHVNMQNSDSNMGPPFPDVGGLGKNTDQIPRISGAHHLLSRIIGIKFPEFMPAAQRHLSKIWPFLPWRKLENQVEVFLLSF